MIESHQVIAHALEVLNAKRVAHALGLSVAYVYKLARPMADADAPDATGARNDLDRIEALAEALATRDEGRAVLVAMRTWFDDLFARTLGERESETLTRERLTLEAGRVLREVGEFLAQCDPAALQYERLVKEATEAIAAIERVIQLAGTARGEDPIDMLRRRSA